MPSQPGGAGVERRGRGGAEGGQQTRSPVVRAAAAQPDDDGRDAGPDRGPDQLADAVRRRPLGPLAARSGAGRTPGRSRRTPSRPRRAGPSRAPARPRGPRTVSASSSPPSAACSTSTNPGPPSDIGARSSSSSGACRAQPSAIASAASTAVSVPANLSGATRTRMRPSCTPPNLGRVGDWAIRPMRPEDVPARRAAQRRVASTSSTPAPSRRAGRRRCCVRRRAAAAGSLAPPTSSTTDPGGCWVAEDDSGMLGFAISLRRELLWCPGVVRRPARPAGPGHRPAAARGGAAAQPRLPARDALGVPGPEGGPAATAAPGFQLHPQMFLSGTVDRSALPIVEKVREGSAADVELMDSLDRRTRGAAHGADHELLLSTARLLVSDTSTGSGYAYCSPRRRTRPCSRPATGGPRRGCCGRSWPTPRRTGDRRARHRRQPLGPRRRACRPPRPAPGRLSRRCAG